MTDDAKGRWLLGEGSYVINPEADVDTLLNDASEWLSYAHELSGQLMEQMARTQVPDNADVTRTLGAMKLLTRMGLQCTRHVRIRLITRGFPPRTTSNP